MNPIFNAALEIQAFCHLRAWRFAIIGGLAVQRWGEPRLTRDVDATVLAGFGGEENVIDELLASFPERIDHARAFALAYRVLLIESSAGVPLDIALGALPFEERVVQRASPYQITQAVSLLTCSAEDLIVLKAFAGRDGDWADIAGIAQRQAGRLDEALVWAELVPLLELKEGPTNAEDRLRLLLRQRG